MRKYIIISVSIISFIIGVVVNNTYKENELETIKKLSNIEDIYVKKSKDSEIIIEKIRKKESDCWIATIKSKSDKNIVKAGFANDEYRGQLETVDSFAKRHNAILAINGSGLDKKGEFYGVVIRDGKVYKNEKEYVNRPTLAVMNNGNLKIVDSNKSGEELIKEGVKETFSFGIALTKDSKKLEEGSLDNRLNQKHPRTAIGQNEKGDYIILVADGRTKESQGLTPYEVADIMSSKGCIDSIMLDGGGSSTLYFEGEVINNPSNGKTREVAEIIYFN